MTRRLYTITCPRPGCSSTATEEYGHPILGTDDHADCARCLTCGHSWALDPGATGACPRCGGSGNEGGAGPWAPRCSCVLD
jgi:hypothetical protein